MNFTAGASVLGGIGLFLLGMTLMTSSLKSLAGNALKDILAKFTGGRISAILLGAVVTTMVQSSHVTTIAAIGFVSAGLLTFKQSLGVIFGANLGTTTIGWIVSLLGFKFKIGLISLPLVMIGATLRIAGKKRINHLGTVLCGFALIFIGVDFLQSGMHGLTDYISLNSFDGFTYTGRFLLVIIGVIMTIVMQSSGAAVTMTLAALFAGTINVEQGAALVIGQNIGTTITAAVAGIGATTQAKRTAIAHIMFNIFTAAVAFIILPVFVSGLRLILHYVNIHDKTILLSAFHSSFNILGVFIFTPFIDQFAKVIEKIVPERGAVLTKNLDDTVLNIPAVAHESARRTIINILDSLLITITSILDPAKEKFSPYSEEEIKLAIVKTRDFITSIDSGENDENENKTSINLLHAVEHVDFIYQAVIEKEDLSPVNNSNTLKAASAEFLEKVNSLEKWIQSNAELGSAKFVKGVSKKLKNIRKDKRTDILKRTALGEYDSETAYSMIECLRWLDRVSYRIWRAVKYLSKVETEAD